MKRLLSPRRIPAFAGVALCLSAALAFAGESAANLTAAGIPANCADFAAKVSSSEGNWNSVNPYGCLGAFQFCLSHSYLHTRRKFKTSWGCMVH